MGTEAHNATELVQFLEEWVNSQPALQVDHFELWIDMKCPVPISSAEGEGRGQMFLITFACVNKKIF